MLSISWITPFLVLISALVTRERLMRTPAVNEKNSILNIADTSWVSTRGNLKFGGFWPANLSAQLQELARLLKFCALQEES